MMFTRVSHIFEDLVSAGMAADYAFKLENDPQFREEEEEKKKAQSKISIFFSDQTKHNRIIGTIFADVPVPELLGKITILDIIEWRGNPFQFKNFVESLLWKTKPWSSQKVHKFFSPTEMDGF